MLTTFFPDSRNADASRFRRPLATAAANLSYGIGTAVSISDRAQLVVSKCPMATVHGTREGIHGRPFSGFDNHGTLPARSSLQGTTWQTSSSIKPRESPNTPHPYLMTQVSQGKYERARDLRIPRSLRVRRAFLRLLAMSGIVAVVLPATAAPATEFERGRYLVVTSHCNNCHTAGYVAAEGSVPEDKWLMGNPVGWKGRDGTVFAPNLRLMLRDMSEDQWLLVTRQARARPPMPWWSVRDMNDDDLRMMYRYIRSLSPLGSAAPDFLPADKQPRPPYNQLPDMSLPR